MSLISSLFKKEDSLNAFLAPLEAGDAMEFFQCATLNRERISRWMSWMTERFSYETACELLQRSAVHRRIGEGFWLAIRLNEKLIGCAIYSDLSQMERQAEIGYWIDSRYEGKGIVLRATRSLIEYAFRVRHLDRIVGRCAVENTRSRTITQALGFAETALQKKAEQFGDEWRDVVIYTLTQETWKKRMETSPALPKALPLYM